jgi:hypothetical protein
MKTCILQEKRSSCWSVPTAGRKYCQTKNNLRNVGSDHRARFVLFEQTEQQRPDAAGFSKPGNHGSREYPRYTAYLDAGHPSPYGN